MTAASSVTIELDVSSVPVFPGATIDDALAGGEEYELLFAAPLLDPSALSQLAAAAGVQITAIGRVTAGTPELIGLRDGMRVALPGGYDHFSV